MSPNIRNRRLALLIVTAVVTLALHSEARAQGWTALSYNTPPDPLGTPAPWDAVTFARNLATLLNGTDPAGNHFWYFPAGSTSNASYYLVVVAADHWSAMYQLAPGCITGAPGTYTVAVTCDTQSTRIDNSRKVSVIGFAVDPNMLDWTVAVTRRKQPSLADFVGYAASAVAGAVVAAPVPPGPPPPPGPPRPFYMRSADLTVKPPANIELKATILRPRPPFAVGGHAYPSPTLRSEEVSRTYRNYSNERLSFGLGLGVREITKFDAVTEDEMTMLAESRVDKIKAYGMVNLHLSARDPDTGLQTIPWFPYGVFAIEADTTRFNYSIGFGMSLGWMSPYMRNLGLVALHTRALPEIADAALGLTTLTQRERAGNWHVMVQYTVTLK